MKRNNSKISLKKPFLIGLLVFGLIMILAQYLAYQKYLISKDVQEEKVLRELNSIKSQLRSSMQNSISATKTLAFLVEKYGEPEDFNDVAKTILGTSQYLDALQLTKKGVIINTYPIEGNEGVTGFDVLADPYTAQEAYKAIKLKKLFFAGPIQLRQGGIGVIGRLPIFRDSTFWGFSVAIIRLSTLLESAGIDTSESSEFIYQLSKKNPLTQVEEFFLPNDISSENNLAASTSIPDGEWKLYVMAKDDSNVIYDTILFSIIGFLLSFICGLFAFQLAIQPIKLRFLVNEKTHQLAASEKYYRSLIEKSSDAIVLIDRYGKVVYQSPGTERISGYSLEEIKKVRPEDLIHPDDHLENGTSFNKLIASPGLTLKKSHRFKHKSGHYIFIEGTYTNLLEDESVRAIVYNYQDITARVELEQRTVIANRLYEVVSRINQMMVHVADDKTLFQEVCDIAVNVGTLRMAWIGMVDHDVKKVIPIVSSGADEGYLATIKLIEIDTVSLRNGPTGRAAITGEYAVCNDIENDETMRPWAVEALNHGYYSSIGIPIKKFGKVVGVFSLYAPIKNYFDSKEISLLLETTDGISFTLENFEKEKMRVVAENEAMKAYKEHETTLSRINDSVVSVDREWRYTFLNDAAMRTHPLGKEQTLGKRMDEVHPKLVETQFWKKYQEAMNTQCVVELEDYYEPMGTWFLAKIYPSEDGLTIFYKDITDRKKAEQEILAEKILSESIINSLPGVFYLYDRDGKFFRWNENFEFVSGYSHEEIGKMNPLDFFDGTEKELLQKQITRVFESGSSEVVANFYTKSKKKIPYFFNGHKISFNGVEYLIGMGIDVTESVKAENELRTRAREIQQLTGHLQSIREEERTRISREIHDELGQELTGLKMDISWISKKIQSSNEVVNKRITSMIELIDNTIKTVRRIASELRPGILDDLGLIAAIEWQGQEFEKRTGIKSLFLTELVELYPEKSLSTNVFRVYQEALTNIVRHAEATKVETKLSLENGYIILTIEDNGKGFDSNSVKSKNTLGLLGMRERALLFRGELTVVSELAKGTLVTLKVPLDNNTTNNSDENINS